MTFCFSATTSIRSYSCPICFNTMQSRQMSILQVSQKNFNVSSQCCSHFTGLWGIFCSRFSNLYHHHSFLHPHGPAHVRTSLAIAYGLLCMEFATVTAKHSGCISRCFNAPATENPSVAFHFRFILSHFNFVDFSEIFWQRINSILEGGCFLTSRAIETGSGRASFLQFLLQTFVAERVQVLQYTRINKEFGAKPTLSRTTCGSIGSHFSCFLDSSVDSIHTHAQ